MPDHWVTSPGGARLAVDDTGAGACGSAPWGRGSLPPTTLVFSHGYMMNRHMFAPQVAHFRSTHRCVCWDARGHGDTQWQGAFTYWDSAGDLLAICGELALENVIHVGMSQGGLVGMRAALLEPDRLAGLVQLSTQAGEVPQGPDDTFARVIEGWIENGADDEMLDFLASFILGPGVDHKVWHDHWRAMTRAQVRDATGALMTIDPLWHRLADLALPIATIHGLADLATSHELGLRTPAGVRDARATTLIEGGPHAVNISHPGEVNRAIEAFLADLARQDVTAKG